MHLKAAAIFTDQLLQVLGPAVHTSAVMASIALHMLCLRAESAVMTA